MPVSQLFIHVPCRSFAIAAPLLPFEITYVGRQTGGVGLGSFDFSESLNEGVDFAAADEAVTVRNEFALSDTVTHNSNVTPEHKASSQSR